MVPANHQDKKKKSFKVFKERGVCMVEKQAELM